MDYVTIIIGLLFIVSGAFWLLAVDSAKKQIRRYIRMNDDETRMFTGVGTIISFLLLYSFFVRDHFIGLLLSVVLLIKFVPALILPGAWRNYLDMFVKKPDSYCKKWGLASIIIGIVTILFGF